MLDEKNPHIRNMRDGTVIKAQNKKKSRMSPGGPSSAPSAQSISEESITCIAVKEDRHQNIMSSVALKKGVEELWTIARVAKFIDLLGYHEITLKCETGPEIIAFINRVAALRKAEVTTEDAVNGDKESNGLIGNAVVLLRGIIRAIKCHIESSTQEPLSDESLVLPWLVEHAGCILSRCQMGLDGKTLFERLHGKKQTQEFVPFGKNVLAKQITTEPRNRTNPRYQYGFWLGNAKQQRRMFHWECRWRTQRSSNQKIGTSEQVGRRSHPQCDWSTLENDGWKVDSGQTRSSSGPRSNPSVAVRGSTNSRGKNHQARHWRIRSHDWMPRLQCKQRQQEGTSPLRSCRKRIEECLRTTPHEAERLDRRNEVSGSSQQPTALRQLQQTTDIGKGLHD